jgi:pectinesterase
MSKAIWCLISFVVVMASSVDVLGKGVCEIVVAKNGSGDVSTIQEAVDKVPVNNVSRCFIKIKPGTYNEQVKIPSSKPYISFIGEDASKTTITYKISNKDVGSTMAAYTVYVGGHDFYAENITFENSYGIGSQAVAMVADADRIVIRKCRFLGWQDTLYAKNGRQYYFDSYIEGHVDYIFGQAAAVFENCHIHSKADGYIAAPMRFSADENSGLIFINCRITSADTKNGVFLGRPWRDYGRAVFINTKMDAAIRPERWNSWEPQREKTSFLAEYGSSGIGADSGARATWAKKLTEEQIKQFDANVFLKANDEWTPKSEDGRGVMKSKPEYEPVKWSEVNTKPTYWYAVDEATRIANQVLLYQRANGGWQKNIDMAEMLNEKERQQILQKKLETDTTIDNKATTSQLEYLARVIAAKNIQDHKNGFNRGLDFLFQMQYDNGGFPQYYPLRNNYSRHITFNDNAMINVLRLLSDVSELRTPFGFVQQEYREKAVKAVDKALPVLLKTQVVVNGKKTIWAAQYDEVTLKPAAARAFEPACLSAGESVGIVRYLMFNAPQNDEVVSAIEAAINWFRENQQNGIKWEKVNSENVLVKDDKAKPVWARFYEIETMKPIFIGRDGKIKYSVMEIEAERRNGYAWYVYTPNELLDKDYVKWSRARKKI